MTISHYKIHARGPVFFAFIVLSISIWCMFIYYGIIENNSKGIGLQDMFVNVTVGFLISLYFSIIAFRYWKSNYIEIKEKEFHIGLKNELNLKRWILGKIGWITYSKKSIKLADIKTVILKKPKNKLLAACVEIHTRNSEPYYFDTQHFSKSDFWKLVDELKRIGINVIWITW